MDLSLIAWADLAPGPLWLTPPGLGARERAWLARLREAVPAEPETVWVLSSGTTATGGLKCLGLSRAAILASAAAVNQHLRSTARDRWLVAIPTHLVGGFAIAARAHLSGAAVDVSPPWDARAFTNAVRDLGVTLTSLVPTQIYDLVAANLRAPPSLRAIVVGGGALSPHLYLRARALGWPTLPSYGLTETASQVATAPLDADHDQFPGLTPLSHAEIQIRDGVIHVRATSLAHARALIDAAGVVTVSDPAPDGWLATEDLGELTPGGGLRVLGRRDEVIKVLGTLVATPAVEAAAREFLGAGDEVVVLPIPDARRGAELMLVTDQTKSLETLARGLDAYNRATPGPRRLNGPCWVPRIPRTALGKVRRAALRDQIAPDDSPQ